MLPMVLVVSLRKGIVRGVRVQGRTVCARASSSLCCEQVHQNDEYFYIVMDLCQGNLHDLIAAQVVQSSPQRVM